ncbi:MAG: hypothetical protein PUD72_02195 [Oscillospiraceae bacterium]|nr:hypothetical protein [Oscillospiraceae bacterium]
MLTTGIILIVAVIVLVVMLTGLMSAMLSIIIMYTGKGATYDRAGKKMAKAKKAPKQKKRKEK